MKRNKIKEIPSDSEEDYYIFQIEEWKQLVRKIEVKGYQVQKVLYTTEYLLNNARVVTELCIKSMEEYRLWQELRRIGSLTETEVERNIDKNSSIEGFSIEGMKVCIKDEKINVKYNEISYDFTKEEFNRKPRDIIQKIINIKRSITN